MNGIYKAIFENNLIDLNNFLPKSSYQDLNEKNLIYNGKNYFPLSFAAMLGYLDCVKLLVENNIDIRAYDDEAFIVAAENGAEEVLEFLISRLPEEEQQMILHKAKDADFRSDMNVGRKELLEY
jgi:ankyrin repeat protein